MSSSTSFTHIDFLRKLLEEKASSDKLFMEEEAKNKELMAIWRQRFKDMQGKLKERKAAFDKLFMDKLAEFFDNIQSDME